MRSITLVFLVRCSLAPSEVIRASGLQTRQFFGPSTYLSPTTPNNQVPDVTPIRPLSSSSVISLQNSSASPQISNYAFSSQVNPQQQSVVLLSSGVPYNLRTPQPQSVILQTSVVPQRVAQPQGVVTKSPFQAQTSNYVLNPLQNVLSRGIITPTAPSVIATSPQALSSALQQSSSLMIRPGGSNSFESLTDLPIVVQSGSLLPNSMSSQAIRASTVGLPQSTSPLNLVLNSPPQNNRIAPIANPIAAIPILTLPFPQTPSQQSENVVIGSALSPQQRLTLLALLNGVPAYQTQNTSGIANPQATSDSKLLKDLMDILEPNKTNQIPPLSNIASYVPSPALPMGANDEVAFNSLLQLLRSSEQKNPYVSIDQPPGVTSMIQNPSDFRPYQPKQELNSQQSATYDLQSQSLVSQATTSDIAKSPGTTRVVVASNRTTSSNQSYPQTIIQVSLEDLVSSLVPQIVSGVSETLWSNLESRIQTPAKDQRISQNPISNSLQSDQSSSLQARNSNNSPSPTPSQSSRRSQTEETDRPFQNTIIDQNNLPLPTHDLQNDLSQTQSFSEISQQKSHAPLTSQGIFVDVLRSNNSVSVPIDQQVSFSSGHPISSQSQKELTNRLETNQPLQPNQQQTSLFYPPQSLTQNGQQASSASDLEPSPQISEDTVNINQSRISEPPNNESTSSSFLSPQQRAQALLLILESQNNSSLSGNAPQQYLLHNQSLDSDQNLLDALREISISRDARSGDQRVASLQNNNPITQSSVENISDKQIQLSQSPLLISSNLQPENTRESKIEEDSNSTKSAAKDDYSLKELLEMYFREPAASLSEIPAQQEESHNSNQSFTERVNRLGSEVPPDVQELLRSVRSPQEFVAFG